MSKSVEVLGVSHQLQGPRFRGYVSDPAYSILLKAFIKDVDFVFEEAAGYGPSTAEDLALSILGPGHYLDLDPPQSERHEYGIYEKTSGSCPIGAFQKAVPGTSQDEYEWSDLGPQKTREELWLQRIQAQAFEKGLLICGYGHGLSLSFRLLSIGISAETTYNYVPHNKLCTMRHVSSETGVA